MTIVSSIVGFLSGLIPVVGQLLYDRFALNIYEALLHTLNVDPHAYWEAPRWINIILEWVLELEEIKGSPASLSFATGYAVNVSVTTLAVFYLAALTWKRARKKGRAATVLTLVLWSAFFVLTWYVFNAANLAFTPFGGRLWSGKVDVFILLLFAGVIGFLDGFFDFLK